MPERNPLEEQRLRDRIKALKLGGPDQKAPRQGYAYETRLVTFFDILGFKELVSAKSAGVVGEILGQLQDSAEVNGRPTAPEHRPTVLSFSDSIVRAVPFEAGDLAAVLHDELVDVLYAQLNLALQGVFIRGGMTMGGLYMDAAKVFGPGLVRAYELESNYATYPRVVIDPDLVAQFKTPALPKSRSRQNPFDLSRLTLRGDDGVYFGHYLALLPLTLPMAEVCQKLEEHRASIVTAVHALRGGPFNRAKLKYTWLARYHNRICEGIGNQADDMTITFEDLGMEALPGSL
jgi:hypothetical protein